MKPLEILQNTLTLLGDFTQFMGYAVKSTGKLWRRRGLFLKHCEFIGIDSTAVVSVAAIFMGGVLGYQLYVSFHMFGAEALLGGSVGVSLFRELGPVLTAIMVTGRAGAAMAAEIATMRITEQVDALEVMAIDPIEYLVSPRIVAGILMLPILSVFFVCIASVATAGVACGIMGLDPAVYWTQYAKTVDQIDIVHCLVKSAVFGLIFTWVGCFCGYNAYGGARAVGFATRSTVVASFLIILLADYILTSLLPFGFAILTVT